MTTETQATQETNETVAAEQAAAEETAANAAAAAAFSATRGEPPKEEPKAEEKAEAAPVKTEAELKAEKEAQEKAAAAEKKAAEERWLKDAPEAVRESLSTIAAVQGRLRNIEGHIGGLTSVTKELKAAITAARTAAADKGADAPTDAQVAAATQSTAKWKQMQEDFPEWAAAMEEKLAGMKGGTVDTGAITKGVVDQVGPMLKEAEVRARNFARVDIAHEGWEDTVKTPEFSTWLKSQPEDVQALAASDHARDAIKLLDGFKASKSPAQSPAKEDPKARLEAAVAPTKATAVTKPEPMTEEQAAAAAFKRIRTGT